MPSALTRAGTAPPPRPRAGRARAGAPGLLVAARGALGRASHRAVRWSALAAAARRRARRGRGGPLYLRLLRAGGWEPALAGLRALRGEDPGRGPADGRRRDRRGRDRPGPGRRAADRHLRHLRRAGGGGDRTAPPTRCAACSTWRPSTATRLADGRRRGDRGRRRPGGRRRRAGAARRADRRRRAGAGRGQRGRPGHDHRRAAAGGQDRRATRCSPAPSTAPARCGCEVERDAAGLAWSPGSWPWSRRPRATKAPTQLFIEKVEQRYSVGMVAATAGAVRGPAARSARTLQADAAARDDLHDRRLAVRGGAGHDAAAAVRDRQRRPARRAGQVRRGDGAARRRSTRSPSTRPAP